jgi:hypothetical protein
MECYALCRWYVMLLLLAQLLTKQIDTANSVGMKIHARGERSG